MTEAGQQVRQWLADIESGRATLSPRRQLRQIADLRARAEGGEIAPDLDARLRIAEADALSRLGRDAEALEALGRAADQLDRGNDDRTRQAAGFALVRRIKMLAWEQRGEEAKRDARRLTDIFEEMTPHTSRRAQVGRMLIDAAFFMLAIGATAELEAITGLASSFSTADDPDEQYLATAGALYDLLLRGSAGQRERIASSVQAFGRFETQCLPVLDHVEALFVPPEENPRYIAELELIRAAVLIELGRRSEAACAVEKAEQIYTDAGIPEGRALAHQLAQELD